MDIEMGGKKKAPSRTRRGGTFQWLLVSDLRGTNSARKGQGTWR